MSTMVEELRTLRGVARNAAADLRDAHQPLVLAAGKDPVGCTLCYPGESSWPCTAVEAADTLDAAVAAVAVPADAPATPPVTAQQHDTAARASAAAAGTFAPAAPADTSVVGDEPRIAELTVVEIAEAFAVDPDDLDLTVTASTARYRDDEFRSFTPLAAAATRWIRALPDAVILDVARTPGGSALQYGPMHRILTAHIDERTNPDWIVARCCETAYERDLIDEVEFAYLDARCS